MPIRVPVYNNDVNPQPLPGERFDTRATLSAFGGGDATAQAFGQARGLAQDAAGMAFEQAKEAAQQADNDVLNQARVDLNDKEREMKDAVSALKGRDALGTTSKLKDDLQKYASDYEAKLYTPEQKAAYRAMVAARREYLLNWGNDRETQARDEIHVGGLKASTASSIERAASDPMTVPLESRIVDDNAAALAKHFGLDPAQADLMRRQAQSDLHAQVLDRMTAKGDDLTAKLYYDKYGSQIIGNDAEKAAREVKTSTYRGEAQREVARIFAPKEGESIGGLLGDAGFKKIGDKRSEDETYAEVDKIKDPTLQDMVRERVRQRWADIKRIREDGQRDDAMAAANIIEGTPDLDAIPAPLFDRLPLTTRRALQERANQIKRGEGPQPNSDEYFTLLRKAAEKPNEFAKQDLTPFRTKITATQLTELAKDQASILKGDERTAARLRGFLGMQEDATMTLKGLGISDQDDINNFLRRLNRDYMTWKADPKNQGKEPTEDQQQEMIQKYIKPERVWYKLWLGTRPNLTAPEYKSKYEEIPEGERATIEKAMKASGETPTRDRVIELYEKANKK
jgi:hypothetical protein